eukprot:GEZU01003320.1.p1 GENE.GEZU01003320.1~~GEZU01003320.1.p1  ORF type:complete len:237 (-),score=36.55 GEZU01003320.1:415-1125(-)
MNDFVTNVYNALSLSTSSNFNSAERTTSSSTSSQPASRSKSLQRKSIEDLLLLLLLPLSEESSPIATAMGTGVRLSSINLPRKSKAKTNNNNGNNSVNHQNHISKLCPDAMYMVFSFLDRRSLYSAMQVNHFWFKSANNDALWKTHFLLDYSFATSSGIVIHPTWKAAYKAKTEQKRGTQYRPRRQKKKTPHSSGSSSSSSSSGDRKSTSSRGSSSGKSGSSSSSRRTHNKNSIRR